MATVETVGAVVSGSASTVSPLPALEPFTVWSASGPKKELASLALLPSESLILPPFSFRPLYLTDRPSLARSSASTVCRNRIWLPSLSWWAALMVRASP